MAHIGLAVVSCLWMLLLILLNLFKPKELDGIRDKIYQYKYAPYVIVTTASMVYGLLVIVYWVFAIDLTGVFDYTARIQMAYLPMIIYGILCLSIRHRGIIGATVILNAVGFLYPMWAASLSPEIDGWHSWLYPLAILLSLTLGISGILRLSSKKKPF